VAKFDGRAGGIGTAHASFPLKRPPRRALYARIRVRDDGCGMDAATQARVFEPFFTTKPVGTGLGLAVVHGIVKAHHGAITLTSAPGEGSVFEVLLPAADASAQSALPSVAPPPVRRGAARAGTCSTSMTTRQWCSW
jgi:signal transduction histidine kinase